MDSSIQVDADFGVDLQEIGRNLDDHRDVIVQNCSAAISKMSWPWLRGRIVTLIDDLRDEDFLPWLGRAWGEYGAIRAYADETRYARDADIWHDMDPHSLKGELNPRVTFRCNGAELGSLDFGVAVVADIHSVSLHICNAKIIGFRAGEYKVSLAVSCNETPLGKPIELDRGRLADEHKFEHPIVII